jgi:hypothetical protein
VAGLKGRIDALFAAASAPELVGKGTDSPAFLAWQATSASVIADINAAFEPVKPASHWKDAIDAVVPADTDLGDLAAAIEFLTATRPTFTPVDGGWHVTALGYRAGPAGDH